jgi:hypothetical protein
MAAIATKSGIADCNELAGEVLTGVVAGEGTLVGPGLGFVVDVEVQVNML